MEVKNAIPLSRRTFNNFAASLGSLFLFISSQRNALLIVLGESLIIGRFIRSIDYPQATVVSFIVRSILCTVSFCQFTLTVARVLCEQPSNDRID